MLKRLSAAVLCLWVLTGLPTPTWAQASEKGPRLHSTHRVEYTLLPGGDVAVHEEIAVRGIASEPELTRSFWLEAAPNAWPLLQRIDAISVANDVGQPLAFRYREYELRANIDILSWPASGVVHLRYLLHRGVDLQQKSIQWNWTITGHEWQPIVDRVEIRVNHPGNPEFLQLKVVIGYSDEGALLVPAIREGALWTMLFSPAADSLSPVAFSMTLPSAGLGAMPTEWFLRDLVELFRIPLFVLGLLLASAFLQIFLGPALVVRITQVTNFAPVVPAMIAAYWATHYWYFESGHRAAGDDLSGEFVVNFGLAGFTLLFAVKQYRLLGQVRRAAYFAQLSFPVVLLVAWPIAFVDRSLLILPVLALPIYLYWLRDKIALDFGVGAHRIAEEVALLGQVSADELAKKFGLSTSRLLLILERNSSLPLVIDHKAQMLMSAETASMLTQYQICRYCGGATEAAGMANLQCAHCGREYTSKNKSKGAAPMPVVVESLAIFFESLRDGIFFLASVIAFAIVVMDSVAGEVVGGIIGAAIAGGIFAVPGLLVGGFTRRLRLGKSLGTARVLMLLAAPLVLPIVVWRKLRSRRVRIFAGEVSSDELAAAMADTGECSLPELSEFLQCSQEDAAELAWYLVANKLIDAVYDRRNNRLVSRKLYRQIAAEGDCKTCGGFFGVVAGQVRCHYCGSGV